MDRPENLIVSMGRELIA